MQNKKINFGPVELTTTLTTNILNPAVTALTGPVGITLTQPYILIDHIRIVNKSASAASFSFWKGATGGNVAGTEVIGTGYVIAANSAQDFYPRGLRLDAADFLVGGASANSSLVVSGEGEIGFV
jgi:hypothetical protein